MTDDLSHVTFPTGPSRPHWVRLNFNCSSHPCLLAMDPSVYSYLYGSWDQSCVFIGRTDAEAETPILGPPHAKSWLIGKDPYVGRDWRQEEGTREDEMAGWHHRLDGREFEWTPGVGDGQGGLASCDSRLSNWTEQNWTFPVGGRLSHVPPTGH